jgi:hypothetical protein
MRWASVKRSAQPTTIQNSFDEEEKMAVDILKDFIAVQDNLIF